MNQVNECIEPDQRISLSESFHKLFPGAGASDPNLCFLYSFQAACYELGRDDLVNRGYWDRFCRARNNSYPNGVLTSDIDAFFNFIRAEGVPLDCLGLFTKIQNSSLTTLAALESEARELPPGYYIVHAAQQFIEHRFTLVVDGEPGEPVLVYDDYNEDADPPCKLETLGTLEWLTNVYAIYLIAPEVSNSPKKLKKPKKNSRKRSRKKPKLSRD